MDAARRELVWGLWKKKMEREKYGAISSEENLLAIDPTFSLSFGEDFESSAGMHTNQSIESSFFHQQIHPAVATAADFFYQLSLSPERITIADLMKKKLMELGKAQMDKLPPAILCKMSVYFLVGTVNDGLMEQMMNDAQKWVARVFDASVVKRAELEHNSVQIQSVVLDANKDHDAIRDSDLVLFIVPPPSEGLFGGDAPLNLFEMKDTVSSILVNLDDKSNTTYTSKMEGTIRNLLDINPAKSLDDVNGLVAIEGIVKNVDKINPTIQSCCDALIDAFLGDEGTTPPMVEKVSLTQLARNHIRKSLWVRPSNPSLASGKNVVHSGRKAVESMMDGLCSLRLELQSSSFGQWPAVAFVNEPTGVVIRYFGNEGDLPKQWIDELNKSKTESKLKDLLGALSGSFADLMNWMLQGAPLHIQILCDQLYQRKKYRRCMDEMLIWIDKAEKQGIVENIPIFLPNQRVVSAGVSEQLSRIYEASLDGTTSVGMLADKPIVVFESKKRKGIVVSSEKAVRALTVRDDFGHISNFVEPTNSKDLSQLHDDEEIMQIASLLPWNKKMKTNSIMNTAEIRKSKAFTTELESLLHEGGIAQPQSCEKQISKFTHSTGLFEITSPQF